MAAKEPVAVGVFGQVTECSESGAMECADRVTVTKVYKGSLAACQAAIVYKGTAGTGGLANYICAKSSVTPKAGGGEAKLVVVWERTGWSAGGEPSLPVDEYGLDPFEVNPKLQKHALFAGLTDAHFDNAKCAFEGGTEEQRDAAATWLQNNGTTEQKDAAALLLAKLKKGIESFYLAGFKYSWVVHSWAAPTVIVGGYIEVPGGPLGSAIDGYGFSCLRVADGLQFSGGVHKLTRSWLVGPAGHWDTDVYAS